MDASCGLLKLLRLLRVLYAKYPFTVLVKKVAKSDTWIQTKAGETLNVPGWHLTAAIDEFNLCLSSGSPTIMQFTSCGAPLELDMTDEDEKNL